MALCTRHTGTEPHLTLHIGIRAVGVKRDFDFLQRFRIQGDGRGRISRSARLGTRHASDGKRQDNNVQDFHSAKIQKLLKWRKTGVTAGRKNLLFSELYFTFVTIFRVRT